MPGEQGSYDLIRVKDGRSNSKADTFFIAPKGLGNEDYNVEELFLQTLAGDLTGGDEVTDLLGNNLSVDSSGVLNAASTVPNDLDVDSVTTDTLTANTSITDASGTTHTGELADKSDVGSGGFGFPYNIDTAVDIPDQHSVIVEGPVDTTDGSLDTRDARLKIEP